jgi:hypothetical protein
MITQKAPERTARKRNKNFLNKKEELKKKKNGPRAASVKRPLFVLR